MLNLIKELHFYFQLMILRFGKICQRKVIFALIAVIILIRIWHGNMPIEEKHLSSDSKFPVQVGQKDGTKEIEILISKIENAHVLDESGTYHVITDIFAEEGKSDTVLENDITIVSQTSSNHLDEILNLTERWGGPISIAVFTHDTDFKSTIQHLVFLQLCLRRNGNQVHFHLIYPLISTPSTEELNSFLNLEINCNIVMHTSSQLNYEIKGTEYPHNLLRNTAVKFCKTKYVLVIDIDMLPNEHLRRDFREFVVHSDLHQYKFSVFVVPSFEFVYKNYTEIPMDRQKLLQQWRLKNIRPFYYEVCWKCQKPTDYDKWKFLPETSSLDVSYFVEWKDPWEPFYIAEKNFPLYDERFKQYGFNRISQVYLFILPFR